MQGTIVMLMALTGLGCHHKGGGHVYVDSGCYSDTASWGGCYGSSQSVGYIESSPACYATAYSACYSQAYASCYGGGWDACYSSASCYGDWGGHGHKHGGLFSCFKRKRCGVCNGSSYNACYGDWSGSYGAPVFGSYTPTYGGDVIYGSPVMSGQYGTSQTMWTAPIDPAAASAPPVTPAPATDAAPPVPATDAPKVPDATTPPAAGEVPAAPAPGTDPAAPKVPSAGDIPAAPTVPGAGDIPAAPTVPGAGDIPAAPAPGNAPGVGTPKPGI